MRTKRRIKLLQKFALNSVNLIIKVQSTTFQDWGERNTVIFSEKKSISLNSKRKALSSKLDFYCNFQQEINIKHRFPLQITDNNKIIKVVLTLIQYVDSNAKHWLLCYKSICQAPAVSFYWGFN